MGLRPRARKARAWSSANNNLNGPVLKSSNAWGVGRGGGDDEVSRIQVIMITSPNTAMGFLGLVSFLLTYILERKKGLYRDILGAEELQPGTSKEMTTKATKLILKSVTFSVQDSIDLRNKFFLHIPSVIRLI